MRDVEARRGRCGAETREMWSRDAGDVERCDAGNRGVETRNWGGAV